MYAYMNHGVIEEALSDHVVLFPSVLLVSYSKVHKVYFLLKVSVIIPLPK